MTVRPYSRRELRIWLAGLPPDRPFCRECRCPISEYVNSTGWHGVLPFDNVAAHFHDTRLAVAIDKFCQEKTGGYAQWHFLTPRDVITIIDELPQERAA